MPRIIPYLRNDPRPGRPPTRNSFVKIATCKGHYRSAASAEPYDSNPNDWGLTLLLLVSC